MSTRTLVLVGSDKATTARRLAGRQIFFLGHLLVYWFTCALVLATAGPFPTLIVAIAWGIALGSHGFFAVVAPMIRPALEHRTRALLGPRAGDARSAKALEDLAAAVAHEIRNPITAAKSLVQQIAEDPASSTNGEYASVAIAELDRVERAIVHLLRFARDEALELAATDVAEVVRAAVATHSDRIDKAGVSLVTSLEETGAIEADAEKVRRVVENLVANALDALAESKTPGPCLDVACGASLAGDEVWVAVRDNGPGIPAEDLPRVFDPFFTSKREGTGFGLALSRKTIEAHGGRLDAGVSRSGGAELVLALPRQAGRRAAGALP